uniref:Uncharacterized protein n=1 Tax=Panagrolaimus davidi TaxID=227884 RepID=A0A914QPS3_9BILA
MAKKLFLPKIDEDLWQRFIGTFDFEEQFAFGLSSQDAQKYVALKNIKLSDRYYIWDYNYKLPETLLNLHEILAVTQTLYIFKHDQLTRIIASKNVVWKPRVLKICNLNISALELSEIIGSFTKEIKLKAMNPNIAFAEIIKNAPNIEVLKIFYKALKMNNVTWLEDLYKYKEGKNFRQLYIHLDTIEFDVEMLKKFVMTKSANGVSIRIVYSAFTEQKEFHRFADKMSKLFVETSFDSISKDVPSICLEIDHFQLSNVYTDI